MNAPPMPSGFGPVRRTQNWYDRNSDAAFVPLVPSLVTTATVAQQVGAQGEQTPLHEQVSNAQTWYPRTDEDVEALVPPIPFEPVSRIDADWSQDSQQLVDRTPFWFAPDLPEDSPFPIVTVTPTVATVPQQAGLWQEGEQQQQWLPAMWFPVADLLGVARYDQFDPSAGLDWSEQPQVWSETRWIMPEPAADNQNVLNPPTTATVPQQAAMQTDMSAQQDVDGRIRWFHPGDIVEGPLRASRYTQTATPGLDPPGSYSKLIASAAPNAYFRFEAPFGAAPGLLPAGWYTTFDVANVVGGELAARGQWFGSPTALTPGLLTGDNDSAVVMDGLDWMVVKQTDWNLAPGTGDFSIEFWLQTVTPNTYIMSHGTVITGWWAGIDAAGHLTFVVAGSGTATSLVVTDGLVHHVVWTRSAAGVFICYVDGLKRVTITSAGLDATVASQFVIGWLADLTGNRFNGTLDEAAFYARVLTLDEVVTHYIVGTQGWAPMAQGADPSEALANDQRWVQADLPGDAVQVPSLVTTATIAQQAGLWQDQSGQQDRSLGTWWHHPADDTLAIFTYIPAGGGGTTFVLLIDIETGDAYVYLGSNIIAPATNA